MSKTPKFSWGSMPSGPPSFRTRKASLHLLTFSPTAQKHLPTPLGGIKGAVEQFLQGRGLFQPSWRAVIFALDVAGETPVASRIRSYGEPVQGRYTYTHLCKKLNTYTHAIPQHVYHHNSVGCSMLYMWTDENFRSYLFIT